jgi:hypothetical protein
LHGRTILDYYDLKSTIGYGFLKNTDPESGCSIRAYG